MLVPLAISGKDELKHKKDNSHKRLTDALMGHQEAWHFSQATMHSWRQADQILTDFRAKWTLDGYARKWMSITFDEDGNAMVGASSASSHDGCDATAATHDGDVAAHGEGIIVISDSDDK